MRLQLTRRAWLVLVPMTWAGGTLSDDARAQAVTARASAHTAMYTDTDHVTVVTPVVSGSVEAPLLGIRVEGSYLADIISAASVDIVSTASPAWHEIRHAGTLDASYGPRDVTLHVTAAISSEPDYDSSTAGARLTWSFWDKAHSLLLGFAQGRDTIGRTGTSFDVFSHTLRTSTFDAGIVLTLNASTTLSFVGEVNLERGDQSKPYRYVPMFAADVAKALDRGASVDVVNARRLPERPLERLPGARDRFALTTRFGHRFDHGTLRIDERLYVDTWNLHASTTEIRYYADVSRRLTLWPKLRLHGQTPSYFWERAYVATFGEGDRLEVPLHRTGDRELGALATVGLGLGGSVAIGRSSRPSAWTLSAQADYIRTEFLDALYVTSRTAWLGTVGVEAVLE